MKKVLCVFLTIITLTSILIIPTSAIKYDYFDYDIYSMDISNVDNLNIASRNFISQFDLTDMQFNYPPSVITNQSSLTIYYTYPYYINSTGINTSTEINICIGLNIQYGNDNYIIGFYMYNTITAKSKTINIYIDNQGNVINGFLNDSVNYDTIYFILPKTKNLQLELQNRYNYYLFKQISTNEMEFTDVNQFLNYVKVFNLSYVEDDAMNFRKEVGNGLDFLITSTGNVLDSIFLENGSLNSIAPIVVIPIAISVLLLGAYIIKRFSWGL